MKPSLTHLSGIAAAALAAMACTACGGGDPVDTSLPGATDGTATSTASSCADIADRWVVSERGTYNCTPGGSSPIAQTGAVVMAQSGCNISYTLAGVPRTGTVSGKSISASGLFAIASSGAAVTVNRVDITGQLSEDERSGNLHAVGKASGTLGGESQTCSSDTTASMTRCTDVAVAVMRGGATIPGTTTVIPQEASLNAIAADLAKIDPRRIVSRVFDSGVNPASQMASVKTWLQGLNAGCGKAPGVVLIGHSLGGYSALNLSGVSGVCTRVSFDPFDIGLLLSLGLNQSSLAVSAPTDSHVINFAAAAQNVFWGYRLTGAGLTQTVVAGSDHANLPTKVYQSPVDMALIVNATRNCLAANRPQ